MARSLPSLWRVTTAALLVATAPLAAATDRWTPVIYRSLDAGQHWGLWDKGPSTGGLWRLDL